MRTRLGVLAAVAAGLAWAASIGFGTRAVLVYENIPSKPAASPQDWPSGSGVVRPANTFTLVLFAHPNCPCTRATLAELEKLMASLQGKLTAFVWFRKPESSLQDAQASELWKRASSIPGVSAAFDGDGAVVGRFGAAVSGQAMLYDREGRLVFSGGITDARGHVGDNAGEEAIYRRVNGQDAPFHTPVFGCSLGDPDASELDRNSSWKKR